MSQNYYSYPLCSSYHAKHLARLAMGHRAASVSDRKTPPFWANGGPDSRPVHGPHHALHQPNRARRRVSRIAEAQETPRAIAA